MTEVQKKLAELEKRLEVVKNLEYWSGDCVGELEGILAEMEELLKGGVTVIQSEKEVVK